MEYFAIKCVELCIFCNITNFTLIFPPVTDYYKDERLTDIYRDKRLALMAYFMSYMQKNEELFN